MHHLAAVLEAEAEAGLVEGACREAEFGEGTEGAGGLLFEHPHAAALHGAGRERRAASVLALFESRAGLPQHAGHWRTVRRQGGFGQAGDERAGAQVRIAFVQGIAEDHLGRRGQQARGEAAGVFQFAPGGGMRHPAGALEGRREERVGARGRGPDAVLQTRHPEAIEARTGGFEQPHDLNGRAFVGGGEAGLGGHAAQARQRRGVVHGRGDEVERGEFGEQLVPALDGLVLGAVGGAVAGPSGEARQA